MRVLSAVGRAALGALACAAALGIPTVALADEPPAAHDPGLRLHCPELRRLVWAGHEGSKAGVTPREQILRMLPWATAYTQARMRGRLDVRESADGRVTTVVARDEQRQPIATWRFVREQRRWALHGSAECMPGRPEAAQWAISPDSMIRCPGYSTGGIFDYFDDPYAPVDPEKVDRTPPDMVVERGEYLLPYTRRHAAGRPATVYRFEGTRAAVIYRDSRGTPIAVFDLHRAAEGWRVQYAAQCSTVGTAD